MPVPLRLARKLQETLGPEAAEDLVTWMDKTDGIRGDLAELRHQVDARFDALGAGLEKRFGALDAALEKRFGALETLIEKRTADLMKWSFVFWVGAVGAIAALAGVLR